MTAAYHGKNKKSMGSYSPKPEEVKAKEWCLENNVCITPRQARWGLSTWVIDIETGRYPNRKLIGTSPREYSKNTIWQKVAEYQTYYYKKYAK
jgi:isopentenyldiphosphate isomerase